jgi:hypothetical protein
MEASSSLNPSSTGTGAAGVSDVGIGVAGNTSALDQKSDARINSQDEHKASVTSNGLAADPSAQASQPQPGAPLPTNRTKKDIDAFMKQQALAFKAQQKAAAAAAKKAGSKKSTQAPASTVATTPTTTPTPQPAPSPAAAQQ